MANFFTLLTLACLVVACFAGNSRARRSALGNSRARRSALEKVRVRRQAQQGPLPECRQDGMFVLEDGSCRQFYTCEEGQNMGLQQCPGRLQFDQNLGRCQRIANGCQPNSHQVCQATQPENPGEAYKVPHPEYCNMFFTCEPDGYAHDTCEVCGNGTYFSETQSRCAALPTNQIPSECQQKQTVLHDDVVMMRLDNTCHLFDQDLFVALIDRIRSGGFGGRRGQVTSLNQRQFGGK